MYKITKHFHNIDGDVFFMKKIIVIGLVIIGIILFINETPKETEEIRVRILANSNEISDQLEKVIIKEELIKVITSIEKTELIRTIKEKPKQIETSLKRNLSFELAQKIKVEYKKVNFPAKSLNGKILRAGKYPTLLVTIAKGKGKNWWSILYPEFFNLEYDENNEIEYKLYLKEYFEKKKK